MSEYPVKTTAGTPINLMNFVRLMERLKKVKKGGVSFPKLDSVTFTSEQVQVIEHLFRFKTHYTLVKEWFLEEEVFNRLEKITTRVVFVKFSRVKHFVDYYRYNQAEKMFDYEIHNPDGIKKGECGAIWIERTFKNNPIYDLRFKPVDND